MKKKLNNKFLKNIIIVASGAAGAQAITMLFSPIITRMYGPEAFGIMGTFTAMINIFIPIAALTYPIAIVLPKRDEDAKKIMVFSLLISFIVGAISLLLVIIFNTKISKIFNMENASNYLYLLPLVVIFAASSQIMEQWLIRTKRFMINAKATFYQSLLVNSGKVGFGYINPIPQILILLTVFSYLLRAFLMFNLSNKGKYKLTIDKLRVNEEKASLKEIAKNYDDFPKYRAPQDLLFALQQSFPVMLLTIFFGPIATGFYTISRNMLSIPATLVGKAVGDVFYPQMVNVVNQKGKAFDLLKKTTIGVAFVGLIPYGIIILLGPTLFSLVFGQDWYVAGEYARWMAILSYSTLLNRPSVRALPALNAQRFHLFYTVFLAVINFLVIIFSYYIFENDVMVVALFSVSGAIANVILITLTLRMTKRLN